MKAIILRVGQASPLGALVTDRPKCLIELNGRSLPDRQLGALEVNGISDPVVVTGLRDELVNQAIAARISGCIEWNRSGAAR